MPNLGERSKWRKLRTRASVLRNRTRAPLPSAFAHVLESTWHILHTLTCNVMCVYVDVDDDARAREFTQNVTARNSE